MKTTSITATTEEDKRKSIYHENLMGVYVVGTMLQNYILAAIKDKSQTDGPERYTHNKMSNAMQSVEKMLSPTVRFLQSVGANEAMENDIVEYHSIIDDVFWMDVKDLKRIRQLLKKIKGEKIKSLVKQEDSREAN